MQINLWHKANEASQKLEAIPGIGPITASAIVATVGNATEYKNGRQLAAWLGLVPKQRSSGGKQTTDVSTLFWTHRDITVSAP
ncbi:MAG: hypothetical protein NMNS02_19840 [Nitrosomonas sp.]|nr:MAG: hypothetical protein NMNS02_19840 [Nitrosomonas sp.]